jgi:hypothetical protein
MMQLMSFFALEDAKDLYFPGMNVNDLVSAVSFVHELDVSQSREVQIELNEIDRKEMDQIQFDRLNFIENHLFHYPQ